MQEIICVLDKSGSMQSVRNDAVAGFNTFIEEQQKVGEANFTLVWFDNNFTIGYEGKLSEFKPLKEWPNGGMTALTDAIGKTFNHVRERFSKEKPETVVLSILTDGEENSSKEFTKDGVKALIEEHQSKYGWTVIFLAANQDAWTTGQQYGMLQANTVTYDTYQTKGAIGSVYSAAVTRARTT